MNLSEEEKEDITDMVIESRDIEEDLTTAYLKGYADAEEKYRKKIKELEEALLKVKDKNTTLFITCRNSIPKQKVKDTINENGFEVHTREYGAVEVVSIETLEELLEDK